MKIWMPNKTLLSLYLYASASFLTDGITPNTTYTSFLTDGINPNTTYTSFLTDDITPNTTYTSFLTDDITLNTTSALTHTTSGKQCSQ